MLFSKKKEKDKKTESPHGARLPVRGALGIRLTTKIAEIPLRVLPR
jgi:hypothetical protein